MVPYVGWNFIGYEDIITHENGHFWPILREPKDKTIYNLIPFFFNVLIQKIMHLKVFFKNLLRNSKHLKGFKQSYKNARFI